MPETADIVATPAVVEAPTPGVTDEPVEKGKAGESFEEFVARRQGKKPAAEKATANAETGAADEKQEAEGERDESGRFKPKESEVPAGVQKRIDKAIAKQREAERRAEDAERRLAETQGKAPAEVKAEPVQATTDDPEPAIDGFKTYEEYVKAQARWEARQELRADKAREAEALQKRTVEEERQSNSARWVKSEADAKADFDDYDDVVDSASDVQLPEYLSYLIHASDSQSTLAYHLAKDRAELERIVSLPPHRMGYELGKFEARLSAPPAPEAKTRVTSAPKPVSPVGARSASSNDPSEATTFEEFERRRKMQLARK